MSHLNDLYSADCGCCLLCQLEMAGAVEHWLKAQEKSQTLSANYVICDLTFSLRFQLCCILETE